MSDRRLVRSASLFWGRGVIRFRMGVLAEDAWIQPGRCTQDPAVACPLTSSRRLLREEACQRAWAVPMPVSMPCSMEYETSMEELGFGSDVTKRVVRLDEPCHWQGLVVAVTGLRWWRLVPDWDDQHEFWSVVSTGGGDHYFEFS